MEKNFYAEILSKYTRDLTTTKIVRSVKKACLIWKFVWDYHHYSNLRKYLNNSYIMNPILGWVYEVFKALKKQVHNIIAWSLW